MSAGTRSGVNCTRWNCAPMALASDLMARVLARPGTPSTRMCPRDSKATSSRSRSTSCPTMVFLTSYRTCSIGFEPGAIEYVLSLLGHPVTATGGESHDDADRLALAVEQRAPGAA